MATVVGAVTIRDIGTTIPVGIGIAMATTTIGTIRATMTGTVAVIMVTAIMMMTDPTAA